jgi:hypothetical protein
MYYTKYYRLSAALTEISDMIRIDIEPLPVYVFSFFIRT